MSCYYSPFVTTLQICYCKHSLLFLTCFNFKTHVLLRKSGSLQARAVCMTHCLIGSRSSQGLPSTTDHTWAGSRLVGAPTQLWQALACLKVAGFRLVGAPTQHWQALAGLKVAGFRLVGAPTQLWQALAGLKVVPANAARAPAQASAPLPIALVQLQPPLPKPPPPPLPLPPSPPAAQTPPASMCSAPR